jgi:LPXTG-motif cell wall-anchored protein
MFFAALKPTPLDAKELIEAAAHAARPDTSPTKLLLLAVAGVAALLFLAVWLRKKRRHEFRRSAWSDREHRQKFSSAANVSTTRSRGRRRRRDHRPRNPTLDQTGGLPPRRED